MLFERIESEGLAHYSYLVADGGEAAVVDPRRDCDVYVEKTLSSGLRLAYIFETHRNEDYVVGSAELAARTGAEIWHADGQLDYRYGESAADGQTWIIGRLKVQAIRSPGHTEGMMAYLLHDPEGAPWILFSGDALFAGDVGRVDLLGADRLEEMAGKLYDTLFEKLLPLGDEIIVCPAHGAGSACGSAISERLWTTIGLEKRLNPKLQYASREAFVANVAQVLENPPYFRRMEDWNLRVPPAVEVVTPPAPLTPDDFAREARRAFVVDVRSELAFGAAHVPGALSIWPGGLARFAGWFLPNDRPILLVAEDAFAGEATRILLRLGFDKVDGRLQGGMLAWHTAGRESAATKMVTVQQLCHRLDEGEEPLILDVRNEAELRSEGRIEGAHHIHITQIPGRMGEIPQDRPVLVFCGSGLRATIAASLLQRSGWTDVSVVLGGIEGWTSTTCPVTLHSD